MRKIQLIAGAVLLSCVLYSCEAGDSKKQNGSDINIDAVINSKSTDPKASGDNKCLLAYATKYDQLLTEEMALSASGFPIEKLKIKYNKVLKNPENHSISYRFDMGRVKENPALKIPKMALPDDISLKSIKPMSLQSFNDSYRAMTDEEQQKFEEAKKEVLSGNNAEANDAMSKTSVDKETLKKGVDQVGGMFSTISKAYTIVDGVGDAARWNTITKELVVLQNGVKFDLTVDISDDNERDKSVAIDLAKQIVSKCR